jgi:hypothetical protein
MFTNTCYACRMPVSTSATRCPHCTSQITLTGGDPNTSYSSEAGLGTVIMYLLFVWLFGWLVWHHFSIYMGWK